MKKKILEGAAVFALATAASSMPAELFPIIPKAPGNEIHFPKGANIYSVPVHGTECGVLNEDFSITDPRLQLGPRPESDQTYVAVEDPTSLPGGGECRVPNFNAVVYLDLGTATRIT